ncbi:UDP-N-acetylmuramoyl-L-alanyl-D-glutamate--2,6-diaminopimelate ligase [Acidiphilium acidophilum]|uniref:UDP-N-acetylmuramoyl-L-alanyl-D-glutamate--2, 6-diaminopimelate ligase n=1 Tax=Acidiphilium acidophilum TaxID=76588 RepID=UPI002E8E7581|nr:UDP-N-acetylmuramoyl-L-alanyl-D-glutamate--2,6-diaminopimelate ligase [Acidiphilium acidophilum]
MRRLSHVTPSLPGWTLERDGDFAGITADSRAVGPGMIFAALPGTRVDGRMFIADAVARGAAAVLAPTGTPWPAGTPPRPLLADPNPRRRLAEIAVSLAGALPRRIVAITGTNGKTSTVDFLRQIITAAGKPAASLGTLGLIAPGFPVGGSLTTPDPVTLAATLARLKAAGIDHVALEASSHGLDQYRLHGLHPAAGAFTNLTRDHLDYHGDLANYRTAKLRLFAEILPRGAPSLAMADLDPETLAALRAIRPDLATVGEGGSTLDLRGITPLPAGQVLVVQAAGRRHEIELSLPGRFQADNALLAAGLARALGFEDALDRLAGLAPVRGRLELAASLANGAAAYVDYAHTPDALDRLLAALRPHATGRLILVFGAGGDRDRGKRPLMGAVAARRADVAIVTDDNPRSEVPAAIRAEIRTACPDALDIGDRRAAIEAGLAMLRPGDVLAVAGKGHEQGQIVGEAVLPFDDAAIIRALAA